MCFGVVGTLISVNQSFFKLLARSAEIEKYATEQHAIVEGMRESSNQHFSVAEGLDAAHDYPLRTPTACHKTPGGGLRMLFDSVENGGVIDC